MIKAIDTREINISEINPAEYNPRKILRVGDKGYDKLKNSLVEFGEVLPIVWNEQTGNIVGGHQRYFIYLDEGRKSLTVSVVNLPIEKEKALNITLNNDNVGSTWDFEKLSLIIGELDTPDLQLTGFDEDELNSFMGSLTDLEDMDTSDLDDIANFTSKATKTEAPPESTKPEPPQEEAPAPNVTVLPDGEEPSKDGTPKDVYFKLGKYEFMVSKAIYEAWNHDLKKHSDDMEEILEEVKIRLGL